MALRIQLVLFTGRKAKDVRVLNAGQRHLNLRSFRNTKPKGRLPPSAQVPEAYERHSS